MRLGFSDVVRSLGQRVTRLKSLTFVMAIATVAALTGCADAVIAPEQVTAVRQHRRPRRA